jgi:S-adenosylmethionine:tRNA ribosyltransferase-isomerase
MGNVRLMKLSAFDFDLPRDRIARFPSERRDQARLLVVERASGRVQHARFAELGHFLHHGDFLVINDSAVVPARLFGRVDGRQVEMLIVEETGACTARVLAQPAKRLLPGKTVDLGCGVSGTIQAILAQGQRTVRFDRACREVMHLAGFAPLPPYIKRKGDEAQTFRRYDLDQYQTVYSREPGSIAAPTAGLHFTPELLADLGRSHELVPVTLQVGETTFRKIEVDHLEEHRMGSERVTITRDQALRIGELRQKGGTLTAVGTTVVRSLESWAALQPKDETFATDLFIYPGFRFNMVQQLITNFHLPQSSLFILVCAFAGLDLMQDVYRQAIGEGYRFFSYGDAMLIL